MSARYFVGVDLGQARDYSALAVLEVEGFGLGAILKVRHLQRWKLGDLLSADLRGDLRTPTPRALAICTSNRGRNGCWKTGCGPIQTTARGSAKHSNDYRRQR